MAEEKVFLRNVIGVYMAKLGKKNDKVVVVNADLMGTCRNKNFVEEFPKRSFNVGIAEQEDDGEPFEEKMGRLTSELSDMFAKSHELEDEIRKKLGAIGYEI